MIFTSAIIVGISIGSAVFLVGIIVLTLYLTNNLSTDVSPETTVSPIPSTITPILPTHTSTPTPTQIPIGTDTETASFEYSNPSSQYPGQFQLHTLENTFTIPPSISVNSAVTKLMNYTCISEISENTISNFSIRINQADSKNEPILGYNASIATRTETASSFNMIFGMNEIDGRPAILTCDAIVRYYISDDPDGLSWSTGVSIGSLSSGEYRSLGLWKDVNTGYPTAAIYESANTLSIRLGTSFTTFSASYTINIGNLQSRPIYFTLPNGRFGFCCISSTFIPRFYYASNDQPTNSLFWFNINISILANALACNVNNITRSSYTAPTVVTNESGTIRIHMATTATPSGAGDFTSQVVKAAGTLDPDTLYISIDNLLVSLGQHRPMVCWITGGDLKCIIANDDGGTVWGPIINIDSSVTVDRFDTKSLPSGNVSIFYHDSTNNRMNYVLIKGTDPTSFTIKTLSVGTIAQGWLGITNIASRPACMWGTSISSTNYIRTGTDNETFSDDITINYTAVGTFA